MPNRIPRVAVVTAALLGSSWAAGSASALSMKLDPVHSMVVFRIEHAMASLPFGVFHGVEGGVTVAAPDAAPTAMDVTAHLDKLDMGNAAWEKHIRSGDFFNAAQYPDITFKSTAIKAAAGSTDTYDVTGDLTFHGVTKPVTITLKRVGVGKGMQGETRVGYTADFKVSRKDFGMAAYEGPVGDEVTLMVNIEGVAQP